MRKFKSLQGLRAVAFINIFLLHMSTWGVRYIISSATWAVSFFFILSGFLYGCREKNEPKIESWKPDLKKTFHRLNKLYPLYVVSLLMLIPISGLAQSVISQDWIQVKYILFGKSFAPRGQSPIVFIWYSLRWVASSINITSYSVP